MMAQYGPLPIMPSSGIHLQRFGCGDDERFAQLFRQAWLRIPYGVRRKLVAYWRTCRLTFKAGMTKTGHAAMCPYVALLSANVDWRRMERPNAEVIGQCEREGTWFSFCAEAIDIMPDEIVQTVIAHELAHAYHTLTDPEHLDDYERSEADVDDTVLLWGFRPKSLCKWLEGHVDDIALMTAMATLPDDETDE